MLKNTLIIVLVIVIIYLYYQKQNTLATFTGSDNPQELQEVKKVNQIFADFCKNEIGGQDINEIRTKLNGRTLSEILEENEDYETKTDELTRKKGELEAEVIMLTNSRKNQIQEKERIITRLKEEKTELEKKVKQKSKQLDEEQCENNKLTQQITSLETKITELQTENQQDKQEYQAQLRQINLLFDEKAKDYEKIDYEGLYKLLGEVKQYSANVSNWEQKSKEQQEKITNLINNLNQAILYGELRDKEIEEFKRIQKQDFTEEKEQKN